jgi:hypothetical protein
MESQLGSAGIDLGEAEMPISEELPVEKILEQEVSNDVVSEDIKEADDPKQNGGELTVEQISADGTEDSIQEKDDDTVKEDNVSKAETTKDK